MTKRKFAAFDIDGTLVRWQLFHAIVNRLAKQRSVTIDEHDTMVHYFDEWKQRRDSFHTYEKAMLTTWYALMKHISHRDLTAATNHVFEQHKDAVYRYTKELAASLKKQGYFLIAISGSHQEAVDKIADYYNFDYAIGSVYSTTKDGKFTGSEITPVINKGNVLKNIVKECDLSWDDSYAVGDTASDSKMMQLVARPIAFNPNQDLFDIAKAKSWKIVVERKNMIYTLEPKNGEYTLTQ